MNGYNLTRNWYNFKFENPDKVKSIHSDFYFYIVDLWNRLGQKEKFGLPTAITMENLNIGSRNTYYKVIKELAEFGFIKMISESTNQHQSRVIALSKFEQAGDQALDQAHIQACEQAREQTTEHIDKQLNKEQRNKRKGENNKKSSRFNPPTKKEVYDFLIDKKLHPALAKKESEKFCDFYESKNWYVGKNKMKNWNSAASGWINRMDNFKPQTNGKSNSKSEPTVNRQTADTIYQNSQGWEID